MAMAVNQFNSDEYQFKCTLIKVGLKISGNNLKVATAKLIQ